MKIISMIAKIRDRANKIIVDELKKKGIEGLAPSHGSILILLYTKRTKVQMKEVAESIGKDKSTLTALVNKLVKLGYIIKVKDSEDNRITYLELTEKGREIEPVFFEISEYLLEKIYTDFSESQKEQLVGDLEKVLDNLSD